MLGIRAGLYPALVAWPPALQKVADSSPGFGMLRLVSGTSDFATLRQRSEVRHLWCFGSQAKLEVMSAACYLDRVFIDSSTVTDLAPLEQLHHLTILSLDSLTRVESVASLSCLRSRPHLERVRAAVIELARES